MRWLVQPGDAIKPGQTLIEVLTDKATMEVPAPFAGTIDKLLVEPGQKLAIGQAILQYQEKGAASKAGPKEEKAPTSVASEKKLTRTSHDNGAVKAAPSVRMLARKLGVDLTRVHAGQTRHPPNQRS